MTVNLTRIYTKRGDAGDTGSRRHEPCFQAPPARGGVRDGGRAERRDRPRTDPTGPPRALRRVAGAGAERPARPGRRPVGAPAPEDATGTRTRLRVDDSYTAWLEEACDEVNATLEPLHSFVIPGRDTGGRAPAPGAHRLPPRRAPLDPVSRTATPRWSATSTGSRTCCSSSARAANVPAHGSLRSPPGARGAHGGSAAGVGRRSASPARAGPAALGPPRARATRQGHPPSSAVR